MVITTHHAPRNQFTVVMRSQGDIVGSMMPVSGSAGLVTSALETVCGHKHCIRALFGAFPRHLEPHTQSNVRSGHPRTRAECARTKSGASTSFGDQCELP